MKNHERVWIHIDVEREKEITQDRSESIHLRTGVKLEYRESQSTNELTGESICVRV